MCLTAADGSPAVGVDDSAGKLLTVGNELGWVVVVGSGGSDIARPRLTYRLEVALNHSVQV